MKKIIIAIDGFSSCGKSTLARQLAGRLNYIFIDTGAMYRAITLYFLRHKTDIRDMEAVKKALPEIHLQFHPNAQTGGADIFLNGENVSKPIREMEISNAVSPVAAIAEVRQMAVSEQQRIGRDKGVVMDGRDIGTTVFPDAELKIFMTAAVDVRVERRYKELLPTHPDINREDVRKNLAERDYIDTHRKTSPLRQAADARVLDNSNLSMEEQLQIALQWVEEIIHQLPR